jgi:hypothetical protein
VLRKSQVSGLFDKGWGGFHGWVGTTLGDAFCAGSRSPQTASHRPVVLRWPVLETALSWISPLAPPAVAGLLRATVITQLVRIHGIAATEGSRIIARIVV